MPRVLAIDLGGTKTALALVSEEGEVFEKQRWPAEHNFSQAASRIVAATSRYGASAVGIAVPGIYDARTGCAWAPNLWGWEEAPLRETLAAALRVPVVIDNDRAGYVLGEQWLGVARGLTDVVFVALGTGIGVGILAGGRLLRGAHGIAGAGGWWALQEEWDSRFASCGCWESEAAGPGLARHAGAPDAETAVARALRGDAAAQQACQRASRATGRGVANLISIFDPQMVVLGGGLMQSPALPLEAIAAEAKRWAQPVAFTKTRIERSTLGDDAGLLGAARLAFLHTGILKDTIYVS